MTRFIEVDQETWNDIETLLQERTGDDIPKDVHNKVDDIVRPLKKSQKHPLWLKELPEGQGAPCIQWRQDIILKRP